MMIGCCADHLVDEGKLISVAVGGTSTSREHTLSINGQGDPILAFNDPQVLADAINLARAGLNILSIPAPPSAYGDYVPQSIDSSMSGDSWQQGSLNWSYFEGLGTDMEEIDTGGVKMIKSISYEYNISANATSGRVDGSASLMAYYTTGKDAIPCIPSETVATARAFIDAINNLTFNAIV